MSHPQLSLAALDIEIIKKALIWYYRAWSYYWRREPQACVIYPAESYVESQNEVLCFVPRDLTAEDVARFKKIFAQRLTFIAGALIEDHGGYCISEGHTRNSTPLLRLFIDQLCRDYPVLRQEVLSWNRSEKRRQEWKFGQAGQYSEYRMGHSRHFSLAPEHGNPYGFLMSSREQGRFCAMPEESTVSPIRRGVYRRHWNDVGQQKLENLDLFPHHGNPTLWRLARVGAGFKVTRRETPPIPKERWPEPGS